jgi:hypothetical protein
MPSLGGQYTGKLPVGEEPVENFIREVLQDAFIQLRFSLLDADIGVKIKAARYVCFKIGGRYFLARGVKVVFKGNVYRDVEPARGRFIGRNSGGAE